MTKLMVIPTKENLSNVLKYSDAILVGVENMSVNLPCSFTVDEIKKISEFDTEVFVSVNKNMHNSDLDSLKNILNELDKLNIKGIFYYDIAVVNLASKLKLKTPLVWSQEHLTCNYATMNFWYNHGAKYTYVSGEITLDEIIEISKNTKSLLIVPIFGYLPMFVSKRNLIGNYLKYFKLDNKSKKYYIEKEGLRYPIVNNNLGTFVYSGHILNGAKELNKLDGKVEYVTLNNFLIDDEEFINVLKAYKERDLSVAEEMIENTDKGFLYKETIYRVKK